MSYVDRQLVIKIVKFMSIYDYINRTKTYIAGDWDGDSDAIEKLQSWNKSKYWSLHFTYVHDFTQSSDSSLPCSIKKSLKARMNISKMFILVVGEHTKTVTKGSCQYCTYCAKYNTVPSKCTKGYSLDFNSYVAYECEQAVKDGIDIVVLYNSNVVHRYLCPDSVRYKGKHIAMKNSMLWDYDAVRKAIMG